MHAWTARAERCSTSHPTPQSCPSSERWLPHYNTTHMMHSGCLTHDPMNQSAQWRVVPNTLGSPRRVDLNGGNASLEGASCNDTRSWIGEYQRTGAQRFCESGGVDQRIGGGRGLDGEREVRETGLFGCSLDAAYDWMSPLTAPHTTRQKGAGEWWGGAYSRLADVKLREVRFGQRLRVVLVLGECRGFPIRVGVRRYRHVGLQRVQSRLGGVHHRLRVGGHRAPGDGGAAGQRTAPRHGPSQMMQHHRLHVGTHREISPHVLPTSSSSNSPTIRLKVCENGSSVVCAVAVRVSLDDVHHFLFASNRSIRFPVFGHVHCRCDADCFTSATPSLVPVEGM
jgi:hypothetical protein